MCLFTSQFKVVKKIFIALVVNPRFQDLMLSHKRKVISNESKGYKIQSLLLVYFIANVLVNEDSEEMWLPQEYLRSGFQLEVEKRVANVARIICTSIVVIRYIYMLILLYVYSTYGLLTIRLLCKQLELRIGRLTEGQCEQS